MEDAATYMVAVGKISEVDTWETGRLATVRDQIRTEASRRRADCQAAAGAAVAQMQRRGETLATIAELTGAGVGEVRAMLYHALRSNEPTATIKPTQSANVQDVENLSAASDEGEGVATDAALA